MDLLNSYPVLIFKSYSSDNISVYILLLISYILSLLLSLLLSFISIRENGFKLILFFKFLKSNIIPSSYLMLNIGSSNYSNYRLSILYDIYSLNISVLSILLKTFYI